MIKILNNCYEDGYKVIIYTSRGMSVFKGNISDIYTNLYELTLNQLNEWGVKYHQLIMGKAHFDLLIDDKVVNSSEIRSISDIKKVLNLQNNNINK